MDVDLDSVSVKICNKSILGKVISSSILLQPLNFHVSGGSMCCILGGSGSGEFVTRYMYHTVFRQDDVVKCNRKSVS